MVVMKGDNMSDNINIDNPEAIEEIEEFLVATLTNEPSDPMLVDKFKTLLVFQRPSLVDKFKQRAWSTKKIREIDIKESEDNQLSFFFRYWGTLNSYVKTIMVEDPKGSFKFQGKKYSEYTFDKETELDYKSLFEKYVMEEIYNKGLSEEAFISEVIVLHADWINSTTKMKEDDVKNS